VVAEHLVLVCPACQRQAGWADALTACGRCGSRRLVRRLDQVECLDCRMTRDAAPDTPEPPSGPVLANTVLADEVARALDRVLRRE